MAHHNKTPEARTDPSGRYQLLAMDGVGYRPVEPPAANLFFQFISARYEQASSIVTRNQPFGRWGEVFCDDVVAAAMIERLVHHAEVITRRVESYRLRDRDLGRSAVTASADQPISREVHPRWAPGDFTARGIDRL